MLFSDAIVLLPPGTVTLPVAPHTNYLSSHIAGGTYRLLVDNEETKRLVIHLNFQVTTVQSLQWRPVILRRLLTTQVAILNRRRTICQNADNSLTTKKVG